MILGVFAAVLAAFAYGVASVLQARGAQSVDTGSGTAGGAPPLKSTILAVLTVSYLAGLALDGIAFAGNMVADRLLPLFLAQPIIAANLVVTVVLATFVLGLRLTRRDRIAIGVVVASLVVLGVAAGEEGHDEQRWMHTAVLSAGVVLLAVGALALPRMRSRVAVLAGLTGGVLFGLLAVAVRIVDGLSPFDLGALLSDPAFYALLVCGPGGFYMFTVALQTGSVSAASAALVVGETVIPGAVGIILIGDTTRPGWAPVAVLAFVAAVVGAVTVAMSPVVEAVEAGDAAESGDAAVT